MQFFHLNVFSLSRGITTHSSYHSPIGQLGQDLIHGRVLLSAVVHHSLDHLVALALLFQEGAGLVVGNLRLELVSCNIVVTVAHKLELLSLESDLGSIEL